VDLRGANLRRAQLGGADLGGASLISADLTGADLTAANLSLATLAHASFVHATLDGCTVFGVSMWNVRLDRATQANLCITNRREPQITVDDLRVAQFLYLLLHNQEIRAVLDTIASKVALILGRFSTERKPALDTLSASLGAHPNGYIPVLYDCTPQAKRPILETVKTLATLARFVVVDLTDPTMVRSELTAITTSVPTVPIQPLIESDASLPTEADVWATYRSFLPTYRYRDIPHLIDALDEVVINPVEQFVHPWPIVERPSD